MALNVVQPNRLDKSSKSKIYDFSLATLRCDTPTIGIDVANKDYVDSFIGQAVWGGITGTLSNQVDLQAALDLKLNISDFASTFDTQFSLKDTDDLAEGVSNLYFTNARAVTALTGQNISIFTNDAGYITGAQVPANETDPVFTAWLAGPPNLSEFTNDVGFITDLSAFTTDDLSEGVTNLYYTDARARAAFSTTAVGLTYDSGTGVLSLTATYFIPHGFETGTDNFVAGENAGVNRTTFNYATLVGAWAGNALTSGNQDTFIGKESGWVTTTGESNTAVGMQSLYSNVTGSYNVAMGVHAALNNTTSNLTAIGTQALMANTIGYGNTALGRDAGFTNTEGHDGIFIGYQAGVNTTTANDSIHIGYMSGLTSVTQRNKVVTLGYKAMANADNVMILGGSGADEINVGLSGVTAPNEKLTLADGDNIGWEVSSGVTDVTLGRIGADILGTPDSFRFGDDLYSSDSKFYWDTGLSKLGLGIVPTAEFGRLNLAGETAADSSLYQIAASNSVSSYIVLARARGTLASMTAVQSNDHLGSLLFFGYGATGLGNPTLTIVGVATENYTDTARGSGILFRTTPNGTVSQANAFYIGQDKKVNFYGDIESAQSADWTIQTFNRTTTGAGYSLDIKAGNANTSGNSGALNLYGGTGGDNGGDVKIFAGGSGANYVWAVSQSRFGGALGEEFKGSGGRRHYFNSDTETNPGYLYNFRRSRGDFSTPTTVADTDILGQIKFSGYTASGLYDEGAWIKAIVNGTVGSTDLPTDLVFATSPDGSATAVERMRIKNDGKVGINTTPSYRLHVAESQSTGNSLLYGTYFSLYLNPSSTMDGFKVAHTTEVVINNNGQFDGDASGAYFVVTKTGGTALVDNLYGQVLRVDLSGGTGKIQNAWGTFSEVYNSTDGAKIENAVGFFGRVNNIAGNTIATAYGSRYGILNNGGGIVGDGYAASYEWSNPSGTISNATSAWFQALPAVTAQQQKRVAIQIDPIPDATGEIGSYSAGIWFNSDSGDYWDGILWGTTRDTNLYRSAANTLKTDDAFTAVGAIRTDDKFNVNGADGISGTYTFGGGGSGDIASMTFSGGILTAVTTVP